MLLPMIRRMTMLKNTTTNLLYRMTQKMDRIFYVTTPVKDFCPVGNQQNGRMDNLDTMMYVDDTNSEIGSAADYLGWPARATGYIAILELCQ